MFYCLLTSCVDDKSRDDFNSSIKICDGLTMESYNIFSQGAFGGDLEGQWLTDSTSFRMFLGTCDYQYTRISVECNGDDITVTKQDDKKITSSTTYKLTELKRQDNYDK